MCKYFQLMTTNVSKVVSQMIAFGLTRTNLKTTTNFESNCAPHPLQFKASLRTCNAVFITGLVKPTTQRV
jgi:hypothetical protein